jgi:hypothetical protein
MICDIMLPAKLQQGIITEVTHVLEQLGEGMMSPHTAIPEIAALEIALQSMGSKIDTLSPGSARKSC